MPPHDTTPPRAGHDLALAALDGGPRTMSSLEIAELCEKRHDHVLRDIRKALADLDKLDGGSRSTSPRLWGKVPSAGGRPMDVAHLPKRESLIMVSGYSVKVRARIVDRWQELERAAAQAPAIRVPTTLRDALRLALAQEERIEAQEALIEAQRPAVAVVERIRAATDTMTITEAAKLLKMTCKALTAYLIACGWVFRRGERGRLQAAQRMLGQGLLAHDAYPVPTPLGPVDAYTVKVTPKGLARLAALLVDVQLDLGLADDGEAA